MLLAIPSLFQGTRRGFSPPPPPARAPPKQSAACSQVPLIAFAIVFLGPSAVAPIMIYLGYKFGLIQPGRFGYSFSTFIRDLPFDFAVINWALPLYTWLAACAEFRLGPVCDVVFRGRNVPPKCFLVFPGLDDGFQRLRCGQGIGVIEAIAVIWPIIAMIWPGPAPGIFDPGFGIGFVISTLTAPIPLLGLIGWLAGQLIGDGVQFSTKSNSAVLVRFWHKADISIAPADVCYRSGSGQHVAAESATRRLNNSGAPEGIRTPDPQIRSLVLYPAELPAPRCSVRENGAPGEIRTPDPQIRSLVLYPAELRALCAAAARANGRG